MSDFNLIGLDNILDTLEEKLGEENMRKVSGKALRKIALEVKPDMEKMASTFKDTGATEQQIVIGNVSWADYYIPRIKIGWRKASDGESPRWNIEHLNEMGYTQHGVFYRPGGFGKLQELVDEYESLYPAMVQEELKELLV